jgi:hypothetical protein
VLKANLRRKRYKIRRSNTYKVKGIFRPMTGREGPEGEKMYSSTLSLTLAIDGGG